MVDGLSTVDLPEGLVFVVDDDPAVRMVVGHALGQAGFEVREFETGEAGLAGFSSAMPDAVCLDLGLPDADGLDILERIKARHPDLPVVILTATTEVGTVVTAMRRGAYDYLPKPLDPAKLVTTLHNAAERGRMSLRLAQLEREVVGTGYPGILGGAPSMKELFRKLDRVCRGDITVLIVGESGTGKELVAQAIHRSSGRRSGPFVALNCAAIPESLQESELFGHERGAFTGALNRRLGSFEQADRGTLLLDEVAELAPTLQAKLLRVLQQRTFQRVGGSGEIRSDFRLLAATHRDLAKEVEKGRFREDLYFRVAVFELPVPPLRERRQDIALLAEAFLKEMRRKHGTGPLRFTAEALRVLEDHPWPGNVRELQNVVEQVVVIAPGEEVRVEDLPERVRGEGPTVAAEPPPPPAPPAPTAPPVEPEAGSAGEEGELPRVPLAELERRAIRQALRRTGGNVTEAGRQLGLGRATLYRKLKQYGPP